MAIDPDLTPVVFPPHRDSYAKTPAAPTLTELFEMTDAEVDNALDHLTPTAPLPLVRRRPERKQPPVVQRAPSRSSWDPPPLRKLLESMPPPPQLPERDEDALACALSMKGPSYGMSWDAPALAATSEFEIDWDPTYEFTSPKRDYWRWATVGAAYALGITTVVAFGWNTEETATWASSLVQSSDADLPSLTRTAPLQRDRMLDFKAPIKVKAPLSIVGYVTDPPPPPAAVLKAFPPRPQPSTTAPAQPKVYAQPSPRYPRPQATPPKAQEIDLARLRVVVGAKAAQASGCGDGVHGGSTRVAITFAPSGRATRRGVDGRRIQRHQSGELHRLGDAERFGSSVRRRAHHCHEDGSYRQEALTAIG